MDHTNKDILRLLRDNGRMSFTEIYLMTGENRIHATAVAPDVSELKYLAKMVNKVFADKLETMTCHGVKGRVRL